MEIKKILTLCIIIFVAQHVTAQNARFANQGTIVYEKKVNMVALIKEYLQKKPNDSWGPKVLEDYQKNNPAFKVMKSTLTFGRDQTLYIPTPDATISNGWFNFSAAQQNNTTYTNTLNGTSTTQKKVFEEIYLVKDSTRKINWKLTNEFRNIAGYDCRRANAIIMDSIYVVAFYTDKIPVSGGPESFCGLPGMILGIALPKYHTTWFATGVTDQPVTDDKLKAPVKGKPTDNKKLWAILKEALKDWGADGLENLREFMM